MVSEIHATHILAIARGNESYKTMSQHNIIASCTYMKKNESECNIIPKKLRLPVINNLTLKSDVDIAKRVCKRQTSHTKTAVNKANCVTRHPQKDLNSEVNSYSKSHQCPGRSYFECPLKTSYITELFCILQLRKASHIQALILQ